MKDFGLFRIRKASRVCAPFATYLLIGLIVLNVIKHDGILDNSMYFTVWGIAAAVIIGLKECFDNRAVTIGISMYVVFAVLWFGILADESYRIHAVLAVIGVAGMLLLHGLYRWRAVRVLSGYLILLILLCLAFMDYSFSSAVNALAVFLFLNSVSEMIALFEHYRTDTFLVFYIAIALITAFTPAPEDPYDWDFVVKAVQAVGNTAEHIMLEVQYWWGQDKSDGMFAYGYTGYSDTSSLLTAGIRNRETEQLVLDGKRTRRNLYLKGRTSDSFTGERWEMTLEEQTMDSRIDTLETLYALLAYTQNVEELHRFVEVYEHKVTLSYIRTQSQFYPIKLLRTTVSDMQYRGDNPISDQIQSKGYHYSYQFVDIDYASAELATIIGNSKDISYEEEKYDLIYTKMQDYYGITLEKVPFSDFLEQIASGEERIRRAYGIADSAVSEQVKELAIELTEDCENDYEKCRALEHYLYQYSYNQNIAMPEDANVLDWFLFDGRQGFCVHYATALAEMLRCIGISARVAEGFLVDYSDSFKINQFSISSGSAHAWVEAYIEGFGWMRLEPTVVNASNANMVWYAAAQDRQTKESIISEEDLEQSTLGTETSGQELADKESSEETDGVMADVQKNADFWILLAAWFGGLTILILMILLALWLYRRMVQKKSNDPDVIFRHLLSLLERKFSPKENSETLREYFARLSGTGQLSDETTASLALAAAWMEQYWYAGIALSENDIQTLKSIRDKIL